MLKKAIPLFLMSGLVLGACNMNGAAPNDNNTPMQNDLNDRDRNWEPNVNDEQRGGTDLDGIDNNRDGNNNNGNGVINDGNTNTPNNGVIDDNLNEDTNRMNR